MQPQKSGQKKRGRVAVARNRHVGSLMAVALAIDRFHCIATCFFDRQLTQYKFPVVRIASNSLVV